LSLHFEVVHSRGIDNTRPDALSRLDIAAISHVNQIGLSRDQLVRNKSAPDSRVEKLKMIEDTHAYGHFGLQAIFMKIWHDGFWWPQIRDDIKSLVDDCVACQIVNVQRHGYHPLKSISAARPLDHIQVDLVVGVPRSKEGFTAIVVSKDIHTGYIWCYRGRSRIVKIIRQFGPMKILHTDNGREFKNKLLCKITDFIKVQHRFGSSYHPRAQGAVERENSNIEKLLKKMCQGAVHTWPLRLDYVASCLNARISSVKGTSAFLENQIITMISVEICCSPILQKNLNATIPDEDDKQYHSITHYLMTLQ
jgi:transposase InsO family protein